MGQGADAHDDVVGVVRLHHRRLLAVAHGVDAAVAQHVKKNVLVAEKIEIVRCFLDADEPLFDREQVQLLHDPHLMAFERDFSPIEK